jgi:hypothetical protein
MRYLAGLLKEISGFGAHWNQNLDTKYATQYRGSKGDHTYLQDFWESRGRKV